MLVEMENSENVVDPIPQTLYLTRIFTAGVFVSTDGEQNEPEASGSEDLLGSKRPSIINH